MTDDLAAHACSEPPRFLVVEDHPMMRDALRQTLHQICPSARVVLAATLDDAAALPTRSLAFELILVDLDLPDSIGLSTWRAMRALYPGRRIAVYSGREDRSTIVSCLKDGACGFLPKSLHHEAVRHALQFMLAGERFVPPQAVSGEGARPRSGPLAGDGNGIVDPRRLGLTRQQLAVLSLILQGLPNKLICRELRLAEGTVKVHVGAVLRALGVRSRTQAIVAARDLGLPIGEVAPPLRDGAVSVTASV